MEKILSVLKIAVMAVLIVGLSGCSYHHYAPSAQNVPLFKEKHDAKLSLATGESEGDNFGQTFDLQTAYAATDKVGVMFNLYSRNKNNQPNDNVKFSILASELGVGRFKKLKSNGLFEVYGGYGFAKVENSYAYSLNRTFNFHKLFIQPAIGYTSDFFDVAFSLKINLLRYTNFSSNKKDDEWDLVARSTTFFIPEPSVTFRGGWKYIKIQTQLVFSKAFSDNAVLGNSSDSFLVRTYLAQKNFYVNVGLSYSFALRYLSVYNKTKTPIAP